jgi:hypothetical protein
VGAAALCAALAAACNTDEATGVESAGDASNSGGSSNGGGRSPLDLPPCEPTFASISDTVFRGSCDGEYCHGLQSPAWDLWLLAPGAEEFLLSHRAASCPDYPLVSPGDPEHSFLYLKIAQEKPPCGTERMPRGLNRLPDHSIACIERWIVSLAADSGARE